MSKLVLYGKEPIVRPIESMQKSGRFVHSYIITGEKGSGRRTAALYIAMSLLCENGTACGECRECRRILDNVHPDMRIVEKDKKYYSVADVREVVADSVVSPNDCERKVYIFTDCDGWNDAAQAALLKATEDPPDPVYFIFTGLRESSFLGTLFSRSMAVRLNPPAVTECVLALKDFFPDKAEGELEEAAGAFSGNIGRAKDYLDGNTEIMENILLVRRLTDACARSDKYECAAVLSSAASDRTDLEEVCVLLSACARDALSVKLGTGDIIGCDKKGSASLSALSVMRLTKIYDAAMDIAAACRTNCNAAAAAGVLSARIS